MSENERRDLEVSEVFQFILSTQAITRARFTIILRTLARILSHLEDQDEQVVLNDLLHQFEDEREQEADALKDYLKRPQ